MGKMRAAVLIGPGKMEIQERICLRAPNEVLVNVERVAYAALKAIVPVTRRLATRSYGHEASGIVAEVGAAVRRPIKIGTYA